MFFGGRALVGLSFWGGWAVVLVGRAEVLGRGLGWSGSR